jgi:hypothetical protein
MNPAGGKINKTIRLSFAEELLCLNTFSTVVWQEESESSVARTA